MQYFPLFVDTQSLRVLIIGAGEVASRKLDLLSRTLAEIEVIAPDICDEVRSYARQGRIRLHQRAANIDDIVNVDLVYLATGDDIFNRDMARHATAQGIWVNVVDSPDLCRFITPSIVDRGRLQVAISTAGAAPVFARELRSRLENWLPNSLSELFDFIAERRVEVQQRLPDFRLRKLFWEQFFISNGDKFDADTPRRYENAFRQLSIEGEILLIDDQTKVELLPIAAMPLLQRIDTLCSDIALPSDLVELVRRDASRASIPSLSVINAQYAKGERVLLYAQVATISRLVAHFPMAKWLRGGSL